MPRCKDETPDVVLVEGNNDCHVLLAFRQHKNLDGTFGVYDCGSDDLVLARMNALIIAPPTSKPRKLGVVLDTDGPIANRWTQVRSRLIRHGYPCPTDPDPLGTVLVAPEGLPVVGIWLMPDNQSSGMLEDFLLRTATRKTVLVARGAVAAASAIGATSFKNAHKSKAVIHTCLAWQDEPGKPLGQSVTSHVLHPDTPSATAFTNWLERLFV